MELFTPDFGLVFWMFVSFVALFLIMWKFAWPAIMKGIDSRAELIDQGVLYAQNAKEQLDNARLQAEKFETEARARQAEILREADRMKSQIIEEARTEAAREAKKEMDSARVAIEQARKEAQQSFRNEVSAFALDIAQKVVRTELADEKAQARLVDSLLDQMETGK
ncbi:ATP synthase subunit b [Muribaculaceae bacterium]|jgi:F-type H+-transporting ATPase subunit b|uniref:F0F1 ATP synthase subunit B n=1 Tax=Paramuribaculum intestinale TaxID=2094151 RepID=UPI0014350565|nr:F0F1 ATP synthase subunit B [Paramuribaculum intestinale]MCX4260053.1 F0F1 ATP synthase subunit B [Muribaculaceae bacterium]GFI06675.1 ATP synthase subunit b [Muribaculaceae bacterium]